MDVPEFEGKGDITNDEMTNLVNQIGDIVIPGLDSPDVADTVNGINEFWSGDPTNKPIIEYDKESGKAKVNGTELTETMSKSEIYEILSRDSDTAAETRRTIADNPDKPGKETTGTERQRQEAVDKSAESAENLREPGKNKGDTPSLDWKNKVADLLIKLAQMGIGFGLTVAFAQILADSQTGCYIVYGDKKFKAGDQGSGECFCESVAASCKSLCTNEGWIGTNYQHCPFCCSSAGNKGDNECVYYDGDDTSVAVSTDKQCLGYTGGHYNTCNCITTDDIDAPQDLEVKHMNISWEDVITNVAASGGYQITKIVNDVGDSVLDIAQGAGKFLSGDWLKWLFISLAIAAVVIVVIVVAVKYGGKKNTGTETGATTTT